MKANQFDWLYYYYPFFEKINFSNVFLLRGTRPLKIL